MTATGGVLSRFKQPEYTGENRCMPCTVVNTIIAAVVSIALVGAGTVLSTLALGLATGSAFFGFSLLAIYVRGYLVPGTPTLTRQYFPPWLLELFGKESEEQPASDSDLDPETELLAAGALEECDGVDDLCLTEAFENHWYAEIDRVAHDEAGRSRLLELLGVTDGDIEFEEFSGAFRARVDGSTVGTWESEAAFLADLGGATTLADYHPRWDQLSVDGKSQLLNGLRLFIDNCPVCDGTPEFGAETVQSCCSTYEVAAVACEECNSRLFETRVNV